MPIRVATGKIILFREGKRVVIRKDQSFDFTAKELSELRQVNESAVRKPRVEAPEEVQAQIESALEKNASELGQLASGVDTSRDSQAGGDGKPEAETNKARGRGRPRNADTQSAGTAASNIDDEL